MREKTTQEGPRSVKTKLQVAADEYSRLRKRFLDDGHVPDGALPPVVLRSWQRCRAAGLCAEDGHVCDEPIPSHELSAACERNMHLLSHAAGVMTHVYAQIRDTGSMLVLADTSGMILHTVGDSEFIARAQQVALAPGASWDEARRGTNAIGTALTENSPLAIVGGQHYLTQNAFLTCNAAPIRDARGTLLGVLDISGDWRRHQPHTLGLVRMSAQLIEQRMFEAAFNGNILIAFHPQPTGLGSLGEALIALDEGGRTLGLNATACELLGVNRARAVGTDFGMLFETRLDELLMRSSRTALCLSALQLRGGGRTYATVRAPQGATRMMASNTATKPPPLKQTRRWKGRLTDLDTGDATFQRAHDRAQRIIGKPIPLLILGESGVGKEMFATAFHHSGNRAEKAFVALNCAAIPENLIESELFGYVGGAFTGARKEGAAGKIVQADGGTLFLDEIGDMPLTLQARLLRVLQERSVVPLGGLQAVPVDVSLICATHRRLFEAVQAGHFREDLYYRINGLTVTLPPLRDRSDILVLAQSMLDSIGKGRRLHLSAEVSAFFETYAWPGNLRQLHNALRVAVALLDEDADEICMACLPEELLDSDAGSKAAAPAGGALRAAGNLRALTHSAIEQALACNGGNISATARVLGISRNTLYRRLEAHRKTHGAQDGPETETT